MCERKVVSDLDILIAFSMYSDLLYQINHPPLPFQCHHKGLSFNMELIT
jgi:hypothetical protein